MDVTSSSGCKRETHVSVELDDWSTLTVQLQLVEICVAVCVLLVAGVQCSEIHELNKSSARGEFVRAALISASRLMHFKVSPG